MRLDKCEDIIFQSQFIEKIYNKDQVIYERQKEVSTGYIDRDKFITAVQYANNLTKDFSPIYDIEFCDLIHFYQDIEEGFPPSFIPLFQDYTINKTNTPTIKVSLKYNRKLGSKLMIYGNINKIIFPSNLSGFFADLTHLESIRTLLDADIDQSQPVQLDNLYKNCEQLEEENFLYQFDNNIYNVANSIERMFYNCKNLKYPHLYKIDLTNVINFTEAFYNCQSLHNFGLNDLFTDIIFNPNHSNLILNKAFAYAKLLKLDLKIQDINTPVENLIDAFSFSTVDSLVFEFSNSQVINFAEDTYPNFIHPILSGCNFTNLILDNSDFTNVTYDCLDITNKYPYTIYSILNQCSGTFSAKNIFTTNAPNKSTLHQILYYLFDDHTTTPNPDTTKPATISFLSHFSTLDLSNNILPNNLFSSIPYGYPFETPYLPNIEVLKLNNTNIHALYFYEYIQNYNPQRTEEGGVVYDEQWRWSTFRDIELNNDDIQQDVNFYDFNFLGTQITNSLSIKNRKINIFTSKKILHEGFETNKSAFNSLDILDLTGSFLKNNNRGHFCLPEQLKTLNVQNVVLYSDNGSGGLVLEQARTCVDCSHIFTDVDFSNITFSYIQFHLQNTETIDLRNFKLKLIKDGWIPSPVYSDTEIGLFSGCSKTKHIIFPNVIQYDESSPLRSLSCMFYNCNKLQSIDMSTWDVSQIYDMSYMFYQCSSLSSIEFSNWDTHNVKSMANMFGKCSSLESIDVSHFNMQSCKENKSISGEYSIMGGAMKQDIIGRTNNRFFLWQTGIPGTGAAGAPFMFSNCDHLQSIKLFDISCSSNQSFMLCKMFKSCSQLKTIELNNFNFNMVIDKNEMYTTSDKVQFFGTFLRQAFNGCRNLQTILVHNTNPSSQFTLLNFSASEYDDMLMDVQDIYGDLDLSETVLQGGNGTSIDILTQRSGLPGGYTPYDDYKYLQADLPNQLGLFTYSQEEGED